MKRSAKSKKIKLGKKQLNNLISQFQKKNKKNSEQTEPSLEEVVKEESKEIEKEQFQEFLQMPAFDFHAPVLESGNVRQESRLENTTNEAAREEREEKSIQYERGYIHADDYETTERIAREMNKDLIVRTAPVLHPENRIIETRQQLERDFQINPELQEAKRQSQRNLERDYLAKAEKLNKNEKLPFESKERKYQGKPI